MSLSGKRIYLRYLSVFYLFLILINVQQLLQPIQTAQAADPLVLKWRYNAAATTQAPVAGDLNGDGVYDIVISGVGRVVAINGAVAAGYNGGATLPASAILWTYTNSYIGDHHPAEIADVNNDGHNEVIVSAYYPVVLNGQTGIQLWTNTAVLAYQNYNANFDVNGDGYKEIFTTSGTAFNASYDFLGSLSHQGNIMTQASAWHTCFGGITVADANFDGRFEVYVTDRSVGYSAGNDLYFGGGMGIKALDAATMQPLWNDPSILCSSQTPILANVDKDEAGTLEVIVADQSNSGIAVYNAADGSVSTAGGVYRKGNINVRAHSQITVGDFDGDGNLEAISCRLPGSAVKLWDLYTGSRMAH